MKKKKMPTRYIWITDNMVMDGETRLGNTFKSLNEAVASAKRNSEVGDKIIVYKCHFENVGVYQQKIEKVN